MYIHEPILHTCNNLCYIDFIFVSLDGRLISETGPNKGWTAFYGRNGSKPLKGWDTGVNSDETDWIPATQCPENIMWWDVTPAVRDGDMTTAQWLWGPNCTKSIGNTGKSIFLYIIVFLGIMRTNFLHWI
jgi:hypothetical protein